MAAKPLELFVGNDMVLELNALRNSITGAYVNGATVTVHLRTRAGADVTGATWPLSMPYVAASLGDYRCELPSGLSLTAGAYYIAQIAVVDGANVARWDADVQAQYRRA